MIGAVEGDAWVGAGAGYSLRLTVPGGVEVGAVGITAIGVMPSHRRRGILRQVMGWLVDQAGERGEPVAILWASETAIYQRFGFGIGTLQGTFDIERSRTRFAHPVEPLGRMRLVDRDEALELIPPVYDAMRSRIPGAVSRPDVKWRHQLLDDAEWTRRGNGRKFIVVLEVDGEVRGYAIYRVKTDWDERGPNNTLTDDRGPRTGRGSRAHHLGMAVRDRPGGPHQGLADARAAAAVAPAGRASPARAGRPRGHAPADPRPARGARGARLRHGRHRSRSR